MGKAQASPTGNRGCDLLLDPYRPIGSGRDPSSEPSFWKLCGCLVEPCVSLISSVVPLRFFVFERELRKKRLIQVSKFGKQFPLCSVSRFQVPARWNPPSSPPPFLRCSPVGWPTFNSFTSNPKPHTTSIDNIIRCDNVGTVQRAYKVTEQVSAWGFARVTASRGRATHQGAFGDV